MSNDLPTSIDRLDAYQEEAWKTAVFPPEIGPLYCVMGALGESGELAAVLFDYYRSNSDTTAFTKDLIVIMEAVRVAVDACAEVERLKKLARKKKLTQLLTKPP